MSMRSNFKNHHPIGSGPQRARCPVCHQAVYSTAGIHPQCAMRQADLPKVREKKPAAPEAE